MDMLLTFLTSRKTMVLGLLSGMLLLFFDAQFIATLHDLGVSEAVTGKLVSLAKLISLALAGLGYSPLKKPVPAPTAPPEGV